MLAIDILRERISRLEGFDGSADDTAKNVAHVLEERFRGVETADPPKILPVHEFYNLLYKLNLVTEQGVMGPHYLNKNAKKIYQSLEQEGYYSTNPTDLSAPKENA